MATTSATAPSDAVPMTREELEETVASTICCHTRMSPAVQWEVDLLMGAIDKHVAHVLSERDQLRKKLKAITEATILWRDRTAGDVGLAIALAGILDAEAPEPPATAAVARVRKLHHPMRRGAITTCRECSGWDGHRCRGVVVPYPCDTVSALEGNGQ